MQRYRRPSPPESFAVNVTPLKKMIAKKVERLIREYQKKESRRKAIARAAKKISSSKGGNKGQKEKLKFAAVWGKYKKIFDETQFGKCGFCESDVARNSYGDMEHYRPKGAVWVFSESNKKDELSPFGYWWLAYDWSNYLFSCQICNQKHKRAYFPIKEKLRRLPPSPRPSKRFPKETPLLIDPYGQINPAKHLEFSVTGAVLIRNNSPFGRETIRTYGLNRQKLIDDRKDVAVRANNLARKLRSAANLKNRTVLHQCYREGRDDKQYVGMVRCFFEEVGGIKWEELVKICARELTAQRSRATSSRLIDKLEDYIEEMGRERYKHSRMVRDMFERTCQMKWKELVERRALQLVRDLQAVNSGSENDKIHADLTCRKFYEMARDNPSYVGIVKDIFQKHRQMKWRELEQKLKRDG